MKRINYQFLLLQVIGIILVVLGHMGGISLFTDWFPPYSFHMPMFIFISGYFCKKDFDIKIKQFFITKVKRLVIPYFIWNLFYGIIATILINNKIINYGSKISLNSLFIEPWIKGHQFGLNVSSWFVLCLFIVQMIYMFMRKIYKKINISNEYVITVLFLILGCLSIVISNMGLAIGVKLTIIRAVFFLPFYQFGFLYKVNLEKKDNINNFIYFVLLFIIQYILIVKYKNISSGFVDCSFSYDNIFLPYIVAITGIMFWLRITKLLKGICENSKTLQYIGSNTWTIMMHHQFVFFIINLTLYLISNYINLNGFSHEQFRNNMWYAYEASNSKLLIFYVISGITIPLVMKKYFQKMKLRIINNKIINIIFSVNNGKW